MTTLAARLERFFTRATPYIALLSALLAVHDATRADYAGVAWNCIWSLVLFKLYLDTLDLDRDYWHDYDLAMYPDRWRLVTIDEARGPDRTAIATWRRLP